MSSLPVRLKQQAQQLGFELVGIAAAVAADTHACYRAWLAEGHAGTMAYLTRHADARRHPEAVLPGVRSVVMVGMSYKPAEEPPQQPLTGLVARYARGADYHDILRARLNQLLAWLQAQAPGCQGRGVVDTAPLLERDFARRAGLGWLAKNTMLIHPRLGSYTLLGALLTDLDLPPDEPFRPDHCGTCTACLDACPTAAFVAPGTLDARRCLSYLTIEHKGAIPTELRPEFQEWLFGCDICQEVCPWNRKAPPGREPTLQAAPGQEQVDLLALFQLSEDEFRQRFKHTALWRTRRHGLLRNAALLLGNCGDARAVATLEQATRDSEPVVSDAAMWALTRLRERGVSYTDSQPAEPLPTPLSPAGRGE